MGLLSGLVRCGAFQLMPPPQIEEQRDKVELKVQAGVIAAPVQPAPEQPKAPPPAEELAKKKPGGVVKKPPAKPADSAGGESEGGGVASNPEPPATEPESKPVKKPTVKKVSGLGVVINEF